MKTIRKVGSVMRQFTAETPEHTLTGLARTLGASPSGTFDIVDGLTKIGFLARVARGRYRLGPFIATLSSVLEDTSPVTEAARDVMERLQSEYGETVHLTQTDGDGLTILASRRGHRTLTVSREVLMDDMALHISAPGRLHLAAMEPTRRDAYWQRMDNGPRRPDRPTDDDLGTMLREGYASAALERDDDVVLTAAVIRNHAGLSAGVLSLAVPASRHAKEPRAYRSITMGGAAEISAALGYKPA